MIFLPLAIIIINHLIMEKLRNIEYAEYQADNNTPPFAISKIYAIRGADIE